MAIEDDALAATGEASAATLLYDFFKHMTSLCLATLGGVLTISQMDGFQVAARDLLVSLGLISFAGISALTAMETLIKARLNARPVPKMTLSRWVVMGGFGLGIGWFLSPLMDKVGL